MCWICSFLLLLELSEGALEGLRNRSCLRNANFNVSQRRNVSLGGVSQALRIGLLDWDSAKIESWVFRILAEEVLGVNTVFSGTYGGSRTGFNELAACKDPQTDAPPLEYDGPHIVIGTWVGPSFIANAERVRRDTPKAMPIDLGSVGYSASDGIFLKEATFQEGLQQRSLSLDFYRAYSHPGFVPGMYFDSPWSIDLAMLKHCNETRDVKEYFLVSNDTDGVAVTRGPDGAAFVARCALDKWWLSPACRVDPSRCLPLITGGSGWDLAATMQRTAAWNMSVAVAVAKDNAAYMELPRRHRVLFYWWVPDNSFVMLQLKKLMWPFHDSFEYSQGIRTSQALDYPIHKWGCASLEHRSNSGLGRPLTVLRRMQFLLFEVVALIKRKTEQVGSADAGFEPVACEWLNNNTERFSAWIPLRNDCEERWGLIDRRGNFVDARHQAQDCAWCAPGRMSVPVHDAEGTTYRCAACDAGTFQKSMGMTACEQCAEGQVAAERGASSCQNCDFGEYAGRAGQSACDACLPTFITNFRGATGPEACICPAGSYLGEDRRDTCLPCVEGMLCPEGSDALGFSPQHAARHPVMPLLKPGFWSSGDAPLSVFFCEDSVRCPGGAEPGRACAEKFEQQGCANCMAGHRQSGSTCVPCTSGVAQILLFPVLPLAAIVATVAGLYLAARGLYTSWDSSGKGAAGTFFILLNHYHVVSIIHGLDVISERSASEMFETISVLSDTLSISRPQCSGLRSFMSRLVLNSHLPGAIFLVVLALWLLSQLLGLCRPELRMDRDRLLNSYFALIMTFFTSVTDMALTIFKCSDNPSGVYTLKRDRSITCYRGEWNGMVVVGALAVLFWCVGFVALLLRTIYIASQRFHMDYFRTRWTFLFIRYRPNVHWWALAIVARGAMLNLGSLFIHSGAGQMYWILSILLVYTYLVVTFRPWRHLLNNSVDAFVHLSLCLTCAISIWLARDSAGSSAAQTALAVHLLKANMVSVASSFLPVVVAMVRKDLSHRVEERKEIDARLILNSLQLIFQGKYDEQLTFLKCLTEHDFRLMSQTKDLLLMEQGRTKARIGYSESRLTHVRQSSLHKRVLRDHLRSIWSKTGSNKSLRSMKPSQLGADDQPVDEGEVCTGKTGSGGSSKPPQLSADDHPVHDGKACTAKTGSAQSTKSWRLNADAPPVDEGRVCTAMTGSVRSSKSSQLSADDASVDIDKISDAKMGTASPEDLSIRSF